MKIESLKILGMTGALALTMGSAQAEILFQDDFSGSAADSLNGTAPDITQGGETWDADIATFNADGSLSANGDNDGAYLDFDFVSGTIYELEAAFTNDNVGWLAVGFASNTPAVGSTDRRHSNTGQAAGYGWLLSRNSAASDQEFFAGPGTGNGISAANGDIVDPTAEINVRIVLDTTGGADAWTVSYFLNGVAVVGGTDILLGVNADEDISAFGFSRDGSGGASQISSLTLTEVPEPSSLALMGLGGLLIARRRRG